MFQELGYVAEGKEVDGKGICPYDPHHNSTVTFVGKLRPDSTRPERS